MTINAVISSRRIRVKEGLDIGKEIKKGIEKPIRDMIDGAVKSGGKDMKHIYKAVKKVKSIDGKLATLVWEGLVTPPVIMMLNPSAGIGLVIFGIIWGPYLIGLIFAAFIAPLNFLYSFSEPPLTSSKVIEDTKNKASTSE
jgi:hypothetical protein